MIQRFLKLKRVLILLAFLLGALVVVLLYELRTSRLQAKYFSNIGTELSFQLKPGVSKNIRFPTTGPFDTRLGYTRLPSIIRELYREGFLIQAQAEISARLGELIDQGVFPIYHEKAQAGLEIIDTNGAVLYSITRPSRVMKNFSDIPQVVTRTLLFIENREILDPSQPYRNPAVEWDRLGKAVLEKLLQVVYPSHSAPGGSTIATQLEKYLHGTEGRTHGIKDKLLQMLSATYRAYLNGPRTAETRENIVLKYMNSIPLAALPGYGEVNGLGDGLWAWYGLEIEEVNKLLSEFSFDAARSEPQKFATLYKKVLSLFVAHRRPSYYLLSDPKNLNQLTNEYLNILTNERLIPPELRDEAAKVPLDIRTVAPPPPPISFVERKAINAVRTYLLRVLGYRHTYHLDQVDLTVKSSLDKKITEDVTSILLSLGDKKTVAKYGLLGERTLGRGDPKKVIYSVTLYEKTGNANLLRVQTDNLDRPFDINEGTRLDLGSTAKFRVLANYLEIVADLYDRFKSLDRKKLAEVSKHNSDPISNWAAATLLANQSISLPAMLERAMLRTYSANPGETFFTGGGVHHFVNFNKDDDGRTVTLSEAMRHSINLPFIRLIRDVLRYYMAQLSGDDKPSPEERAAKRRQYLEKFADKEGTQFMHTFYKRYRGLEPAAVLKAFFKHIRPSPKRLAVIFRHIYPKAEFDEFKKFLTEHLPQTKLEDKSTLQLFEAFPPGKYSLNDQGYIARVHPLELWLVGYLVNNPGKKLADAIDAGRKQRIEAYEWLLEKGNKRGQDSRIRSLVEAEGFMEMHKAWKKFGYPFKSMVPSYASAIGSSGDRPAALAELMGIILNDGVNYPMLRLEKLQFAKGTPFETIMSIDQKAEGVRVMRSEVAATLRRTLRDIVESGTARRVNKVFFNEQGQEIPVGGKTGTGDNRYETFGKGGQLLTSRVVNRTATFVFYIGDRFFGTVTAHVQGQDAANFDFTSALAAELLKAITPALEPLVENVKVPPTPVATETPIIPIAPVETAVPQATLVPTIGGPPAPALP